MLIFKTKKIYLAIDVAAIIRAMALVMTTFKIG